MISVVSSLYNSKETAFDFVSRVAKVMEASTDPFEIVLVWDGDPTLDVEDIIRLTQSHKRVRVVKLSRNFGQHSALLCGIQNSVGDEIVILDSDLEENPEDIPRFIDHLRRSDAQIVIGYQSRRNKDRILGEIFWRLRGTPTNGPMNICTFRAIRRKYAEQLLNCGDVDFMLGDLDQFIGFKKDFLKITKSYKGHSSYTSTKKLKFFFSSIIFGSPNTLVVLSILTGLGFWLISIFLAIVILYRLYNDVAPGWTSLVVLNGVSIGLNLICFGCLFFFLAKLIKQTKNRPRFVVDEVYQSTSNK